MDKEINGHLYIANDNLKRIADALEEILRLVICHAIAEAMTTYTGQQLIPDPIGGHIRALTKYIGSGNL